MFAGIFVRQHLLVVYYTAEKAARYQWLICNPSWFSNRCHAVRTFTKHRERIGGTYLCAYDGCGTVRLLWKCHSTSRIGRSEASPWRFNTYLDSCHIHATHVREKN